MARSVGNSIENNFINGLVTEATGLNFPENAITDGSNCVFNDNGLVTRRKGFDYETGATSLGRLFYNRIMSSYLWEAVGGNGDLTFYVQQVGEYLYFYNVRPNTSLSSGFFQLVSLGFYVSNEVAGQHPCSYSSGNGNLIVAHKYADPTVLRYNPATGLIEMVDSIRIKIRDFEGVASDRGFTNSENRRSTLTASHKYNLLNQGWTSARIDRFKKEVGSYPSNSDVMHLFKDEENKFEPKKTQSWYLRGSGLAPNGHYVVYAFHTNRSGTNGISHTVKETSSGPERPTCVEFFAGRAWYAGVSAAGYANTVYFSQVIQGDDQYEKCHQVNDPTNENNAQLLPTDGGTVKVLEAGQIIKLMAVDSYLLVFCSNGIWAISGSTGLGFSANDYQVKKISSVGAISPYSFVDIAGAPVWWNQDGIFTLQMNSSVGSVQVVSLIDKRIKKWFDKIPEMSKRYAKGAANSQDRTVQWLVQKTPKGNLLHEYFKYDTILVLNTATGAFYTWDLPSYTGPTPNISDIVVVKGVGDTLVNDEVIMEDGTIVEKTPGDTVQFQRRVFENMTAIYKYGSFTEEAVTAGSFSFVDCTSTNWMDFGTRDYKSWFVTGFKVRGDAQRKFQTNYVWLYSRNVEDPSECYLQNCWDYTTDGDTGRWSTKQLYRSTQLLRSTFKRRFKLRGHGIACQLRIESVKGKPFELEGWSIFETINSTP